MSFTDGKLQICRMPSHSRHACGHCINACTTSSMAEPHILHVPVTGIFLLSWFDSVARLFVAARQANIWTFGGTDERQIFFEHGSSPEDFTLVEAKEHCPGNSDNPNLYALRTEKTPDGSGCHAITSLSSRLEILIFKINPNCCTTHQSIFTSQVPVKLSKDGQRARIHGNWRVYSIKL